MRWRGRRRRRGWSRRRVEVARLAGMVGRLVEEQEATVLGQVVDPEDRTLARILGELGEEEVVDLEDGILYPY